MREIVIRIDRCSVEVIHEERVYLRVLTEVAMEHPVLKDVIMDVVQYMLTRSIAKEVGGDC